MSDTLGEKRRFAIRIGDGLKSLEIRMAASLLQSYVEKIDDVGQNEKKN